MQKVTSLTLRAIFLLGFIVALPLLTLPPVVKFLEQVLYGKAEPTIPVLEVQPAAPQADLQVVAAQLAERTSPAHYGAPPVAAPLLLAEGLDSLAVAPAPPTPLPSVAPQFPVTPAGFDAAVAEASPNARETMIAQVQGVRERLEQLGAKYVVLETASGSGQYRFHCQMLLDNGVPYTRDFEATASDPVVAARTVLQDVENWRNTAAPVAR